MRISFVEGFKVAELPICMTNEELVSFPTPKRLPKCDAERVKAALPRS